MRKNLSFLILFVISLGLFLIFYFNGGEKGQIHNTRAFYFWENNKYKLTDYEKRELDKLHIKKLYLKFFEVEKNEVIGIYPSAKSDLHSFGGLDSIEIIPTIYIRNEVFKRSGKKQLEEFADNLIFLIKKKYKERFDKNIFELHEIQLDCDWTESTRKNYFLFLNYLKENYFIKFSATLRLYAYKFPERMGVLPVDRAMLMCYNLLNIHESENRNSILDLNELEKYLNGAEKYPIPLDVAIPIYSSAHIYQNNLYVSTLYNENHDIEGILDKENDLWYQVKKDTVVNSIYLRKGDKVKFEKITPAIVQKAIQIISSTVELNNDFTLSLFQLNEFELKQHTHEKLDTYFNFFHSK